jgi:hypothetical protein
MRKIYLLLLASCYALVNAQVVINEVQPATNTIELKNLSETTVDVTGYFICSFPAYKSLQTITVLSGSKMIAPGGFLVISAGYNLGITDGELGLYANSNGYGSSANIIDYVEWGSTGHKRSSVGVGAGTWDTGSFVTGVDEALAIDYMGSGNSSADYVVQSKTTFGAENGSVTGLSAQSSKTIEVYPNPANDIVFIPTPILTYSISNLSGATLLTGQDATDGIDISSLEKGVYFISAQTTSGFLSSKIIK